MGLIESILASLFPPRPEPLAECRRGRRVLVRGRVVPRDEIESPLGGARCVYYRYLVEEWRRSALAGMAAGADGFWVVAEHDEAIAEFYVQDESGRAIVAPERAHVELGRDLLPEPVDLPTGRRATESRIHGGDVVEVEGVVEEVGDLLDDARGFREPSLRLLLRAVDGGVLRIRVLERGGDGDGGGGGNGRRAGA